MELGKVAAAAAELGQVQVEAVCARRMRLSVMPTLEAEVTSSDDGAPASRHVPFLLYRKERAQKQSVNNLSFHELLDRNRSTCLFKVELSEVQPRKEKSPRVSGCRGYAKSGVERAVGRGPTYVGWRLVIVDASALMRQGEATLVLARLLCDRLWEHGSRVGKVHGGQQRRRGGTLAW